MDTPIHTQLVQWIRTHTRSGPTSTITQATSWQWYELTWAILVVALFGTAGRLIDLIVAGGLVAAWLAGPAIVVSVVGHLAVIGLEIFPEVAWAVVAMELLLIAPIIIELSLLASSQRMAIQTTIGILVFSGITATGVWISVPIGQLGALLAILFTIGIVGLYVQFELTNGNSFIYNPSNTLAAESTKSSTEQGSSSQEDSY